MWTRWYDYDPNFAAIADMRRRMDALFSDFERGPVAQYPATNVLDTEGAYVLQAEVPGLTDQDIRLQLHRDVLTVTGERQPQVPEGYAVRRQERGSVQFSRSFTLPAKIDADGIAASVHDGLLTVTLPKSPDAKPRQISIQSHG